MSVTTRLVLALLACGASGCATARLVGDPAPATPDTGASRTVVIEPFFELAELQTSTRTEYARLSSNPYGFGGGFGPGFGGTNTVAITRQVQEKPLFAKPVMLAELQARLLAEVQRRRPSWRVTSTGGAGLIKSGDVTVVRTIIEGNELVESNRPLKNLAFGFGLLIWPLQIVNAWPVEETMRVYGLLERFVVDANGLSMRMVKYPSQPDYAVNLAGVTSTRHEFGLDVAYEEGLLADERPRTGVLVTGFIDRLAAAVIASVEEP
ncbi:MAG: hypothetical protein U0228_17555 [Myxococcaceae bacterium]